MWYISVSPRVVDENWTGELTRTTNAMGHTRTIRKRPVPRAKMKAKTAVDVHNCCGKIRNAVTSPILMNKAGGPWVEQVRETYGTGYDVSVVRTSTHSAMYSTTISRSFCPK